MPQAWGINEKAETITDEGFQHLNSVEHPDLNRGPSACKADSFKRSANMYILQYI